MPHVLQNVLAQKPGDSGAERLLQVGGKLSQCRGQHISPHHTKHWFYRPHPIRAAWNSFEARMYDARTGKWISPDPAGQYFSPYLGMGNNPVSGVDPDGRFSRAGAWWRSLFIANSYSYDYGTEWAVGWNTWENDTQGAYLLSHSITEGGPV